MYPSGKIPSLTLLNRSLCALALAQVAFFSAPTSTHAAPPDKKADTSETATRSAKGGWQLLDAQGKQELLARLDALKQRSPSLKADFSESRQSSLLKKPVVSTGTIAFEVPNKFRREIKGSNPSLTVSNGQRLWLYYPNFKEAELYTLGRRAMFDDAMAALTAGLNFSKMEEFYQLEARHDGKGAYRMTLRPKKSNLRRIVKELTIDLDSKLDVRRTQFQMPNGDAIETDYRHVRREKLETSTFEFTPPEGVNISYPLGK